MCKLPTMHTHIIKEKIFKRKKITEKHYRNRWKSGIGSLMHCPMVVLSLQSLIHYHMVSISAQNLCWMIEGNWYCLVRQFQRNLPIYQLHIVWHIFDKFLSKYHCTLWALFFRVAWLLIHAFSVYYCFLFSNTDVATNKNQDIEWAHIMFTPNFTKHVHQQKSLQGLKYLNSDVYLKDYCIFFSYLSEFSPSWHHENISCRLTLFSNHIISLPRLWTQNLISKFFESS